MTSESIALPTSVTAKGRAATFLLVDDDEIDRMAFRRAFRNRRIANDIVEVENGIEALDRLLGRDGRPPLERPYIVILDLNMPRMNGLEFLEAIRNHEQLQDTVVFVLTTSRADEDRCAAYRQHIAGYVVKGGIEKSLEGMVQMLDCFWRVVELP